MDEFENDFEGGDQNGQGGDSKFVEVDGKKFMDDGNGQPKKGDDGNPIPFNEVRKPFETPEARKARLDKQIEQHRAKFPHLYEDDSKKKSKKEDKKSDDLDYGQKAFLVAKGIESADEVALVKKVMSDTGKTLDEVLESKYFQAEIKEMRDIKAVADATPNGGNRNGSSASNTVEYWIKKGELPPNTPDNVQLRRDVVNARLKKEKSGSTFTSNPVVGKF